ncbi:triose-phosphate isomerase [Lactobacillus sp. LL6]|uniref:triose-phosphate isomerase n=1 Tax=Lactobacillus sp. LL6 TaxID=2596827 RepID=UPI001186C92B|nr:triose-phosphate isomerase [Lactobacillus sp. LL6]TSO25696.1 triose-phosphate isomerase [Lactobacillus sp. LL6]
MKIRKPFFIVNPKSYLYGDKAIKLAKISDKLAKKYDIDCIFTGQLVDLPEIAKETKNLIITAQHMDFLTPGRGMGHVLPEALVNQGIQAVVLNHAEKPLTIAELDMTIKRAKEVGLLTITCSDTVEQCRAIAELNPDVMICEPDSLIGTGNSSNEDYIRTTTEAVREVNPNILIMQAAGVSTGDDVEKIMKLGADGTGGTSGIIKAPSWKDKISEMMSALVKFK